MSNPIVKEIEEIILETEKILSDNHFIGELTEKELEEILSDAEQFEFEKKKIKNMREEQAILNELIIPGTETDYTYPSRKKFEMYGGYKKAILRQKNLNTPLHNVQVHNLNFRFKNKNVDGMNTTAMTFRNPSNNTENILLLPDDTNLRVQQERSIYSKIAFSLQESGFISKEKWYEIISNLSELNIIERCAQSLLHEYGHIIHWRIFNHLKFKTNSEVYKWFFYSGYADNLCKRSVEFNPGNPEIPRQYLVYLLKESLVEDYRIWLNSLEKNGMFILPNINTFEGDFIDPSLLKEGVAIMKDLFRESVGDKQMERPDISSEPDRIQRATQIHSQFMKSNWYPGKNKATEKDHFKVIQELEEQEIRVAELSR